MKTLFDGVRVSTFAGILLRLYREILEDAPIIETGEWQGQVRSTPHTLTAELEDVSFELAIPTSPIDLLADIKPNMPWAEDHFLERVSGIPHNPPPSSAYWPFAVQNHRQHLSQAKFSHTYPERMWPKFVNAEQRPDAGNIPNRGLRYRLGDLQDVVQLLRERPYTRQAYLPIWFPEDTGATTAQRVPCTLGYHFMVRDDDEGQPRLKVVYYIRSCDLYRHFKDDVYMAARLAQWVSEQIEVQPRHLVMHISSLHVFQHDLPIIRTLRDRLLHG